MVIEELITADGTITGDRPPDVARRDPSMVRYLCTILGAMAVLYLLPLCVVRSGLWDNWNPSFYARPLNYAFHTAGQNADVLVYGDSTAVLGIDPSQMSSALGLKVMNLPNTQASLVVNDDLALRNYLSGNRPPRLIVFYFAPWDFDYGHVDFNTRPLYEGEELLLRQGSWRLLLAFVRKHPTEAISFPLRFYATNWQLTLHRVPHSNQDTRLAETFGHVDNTVATVLTAPCSFTPLLLDNIRFDWVRSLGEKYASPQTKVLFYAAPVPACANASSVVTRPYNQLPAAQPLQLPPEFFSNDVRFLHPRPFAVPQLTRNLTDAVRPMLSASEPQSPSPAAKREKRIR